MLHRSLRPALLALSLFVLTGEPGASAPGAATSTPDHPIVAGFERSFTGEKANLARGGQLLLGELNCTSCHQTSDPSIGRKPAPLLDEVAARVRLGHLKKFLDDPQAVKPGTTMPNLFARDPQKAQKIEALVHFLASTGGLRQERPDLKGIAPGRDSYHKVGCVACHGSRDALGNADTLLPTSVPLGNLKAKYSVPSLTAFLADPQKVRPGGRMPHLVNAKEAKEIASYLLQGIKVDLTLAKGASKYSYFEGQWDKVPDFDKLKPVASGIGPAFDLGLARRGDHFGIKFEGYFKIDREGTYSFKLNSDDGSRLFIDDKLVLDNDGIHAPREVAGKTILTRGTHKVVVTFIQGGGGAELDVRIAGPGLGEQPLAGLVAASEVAVEKVAAPVRKPDDEDFLEVQPALVEKGKALFASAGCASCHTMQIDRKPIASSFQAPALSRLKPEDGCLSANPKAGLPRYGLSQTQRTALTAVLKSPPAPSQEPAAVIARVMTTFNCYACHARDKVGGPQEELNRFFQTTTQEMGDEGRVPPALDGVGAKLTPDYLKQILDKGAHDRPYMHTRMPGFGLANIGGVATALAQFDKLPTVPAVAFNEPLPKVKAAARHMAGGNCLGCVKCHTFAGQKAEGVQGIDMLLMPKRVQRDWFHAYLIDPQKLRPGTRMPTAWPNGKSVLPDLLEGKASTQIEAIWAYLNEGPKAQLPVGLQRHSIPLVAEKNAILYRNFLQGAGARGIGVGYPEKVNLAFDANELRLALLWQGAFIDAARHWTDRGVGFEGPLGDNILALPSGPAFAVLARPDAPWPSASPRQMGHKFLGYRLTPDDRPTFRYSLGDVTIEDFPNATAGKDISIQRTLQFSASKPVDGLCFRAAVGSKIEALEGGSYRIDGWKLKLDGSGAQVRESGGKKELLVPIRFVDGKAQIVLQYVW
jgi:mono/diheme cytochrome c family protein